MAENYKQLFTQLYQRYNPEKVDEVDSLLKKFAGREREMMYKIVMKYGPPVTSAQQKKRMDQLLLDQKANGTTPTPAAPTTSRTFKRLNIRKVLILLIALALVGGLAYGGWRVANGDWEIFAGTSSTTEAVLHPQYVLANAVLARTSCGEDGEKTESMLSYGESLNEYTEEGNCLATVKDSSNATSYFPAQYFVTEDKFREIDAIFGNDASRSQIKHSYEKRALRLWFRKNGIIGNLSPEWKDSIAGKSRNPEVWQIFAEEEPAELNTWARGNFAKNFSDNPAPSEDLVCIIQSPKDPNKRQMLFFGFDEKRQSKIYKSFDLDFYRERLIREYPREEDDLTRFFRNEDEFPKQQGVLLEDPEGELKDYLLLWEGKRFSVHEEIARDTFRIPGLPPIIM